MRKGIVIRSVAILLSAILLVMQVGCTGGAAPAPSTGPANGQENIRVSKATPEPSPAAAAAIAPAAATPAPGKAQEETIVKYGDLQIVSDAGIYIAMEKGYFKEQGLRVELTHFKTADIMLPALATGQLDAGGGAVGAGLFNAINRDIPIKLVADKGSSYAGGMASQALVVRKALIDQGRVKGLSDLKGLKIGITGKGNSTEIFMDRALEEGGLTPKDVEPVVMGLPDQVAGLANGAIDAGVLVEPFITLGEKSGVLVRFKDGYDIYPNEVIGTLVYAPAFMQKSGNLGTRFMIAYLKGVRDYNDAFGPKAKNTAEIIAILTKYTSTKDPQILKKAHPSGLNPDGYINIKSVEADLDWYVKNGYIKQKPKVSDVIDNQYVDNAIKVLGKYQP